MKLTLIFVALAIPFVQCNRFVKEMLTLSNFYYYNAYTEPIGFVRQMDLVANNYLALVKRINSSLDMELREASEYDLKSSSTSTNLEAAEVINKMHARQIVVDLVLYQIHYCHKMYSNATAKLVGQKTIPLFDDLPFESKMNRMLIYEWVNQMGMLLRKISEMFEKTSEPWKSLREQINTNAVGREELNGEKSPEEENKDSPTNTDTTTGTTPETPKETETNSGQTGNLTTAEPAPT